MDDTILNYEGNKISSCCKSFLEGLLEKNINKKVAYLIWKGPWMCAGRDTFIDDILRKIGLTNGISKSRYPETSIDELKALNCDFIFLSSEPYPFKETHIEELQQALPTTKIMLVDGEMFSWYGSRLVKAVEYLFYLQRALA